MSQPKTKQICVVEDNPQMAEMIRDFLSEKFPSAAINLYSTGEKAIEEIATAPDVLLLDYNLDTSDRKALNGIQVLRQLRKKFDVPVIFLTAQERPDIAANIIKYGASDYVVKDQQSFSKLERIITQLMNNKPGKEKKTEKSFLIIVAVIALAILVLYLLKS